MCPQPRGRSRALSCGAWLSLWVRDPPAICPVPHPAQPSPRMLHSPVAQAELQWGCLVMALGTAPIVTCPLCCHSHQSSTTQPAPPAFVPTTQQLLGITPSTNPPGRSEHPGALLTKRADTLKP